MKNTGLAGICLLVVLLMGCTEEEDRPDSLWDIHRALQQRTFVDLTHAFEPGIPHWPGFPEVIGQAAVELQLPEGHLHLRPHLYLFGDAVC